VNYPFKEWPERESSIAYTERP